MTTAVTADGGGEVEERVELLQLARAGDGEQTLHRPLAVVASIAEHDLAPLDGGPKGALRDGMPRAGLCRVGVNRTPLFGADLGFAVAGVSA